MLVGFRFGASYVFAEEGSNSAEESNALNLPTEFSLVLNVSSSVFSPKVVTIRDLDGDTTSLVYGKTVDEVINEIGIKLDEDDITIPDLEVVVSNRSVIQIVKVDIEYTVKKEAIPFKVIEKETNSLNTGTVVVDQAGKDGLLAKTIKIVYQDGIAFRSSVVKSEVEIPVQDKLVLIGTKPVTIQSCSYWDAVIDRYANPTTRKEKNSWMKFVMRCETWCDSGQNTKNTYLGLYQFNQRTFNSKGGQNIWDGTEQIEIVSSMYEYGDSYRSLQWPTCNSKFNAQN